MFGKISNQEIAKALYRLVSILGIGEEVEGDCFISLLRGKKVEECIKEIAAYMRLPINVELSYVSRERESDIGNSFQTTSLSRTDWTGLGTEGIIAQVLLPEYLPPFGTPGLEGYPIRVRVSEDCQKDPYAFVAIMAHELSHVLLASLRYTEKDNELHVDLVPLVFGFRNIVWAGRRTVKDIEVKNQTITQSITYGYLTDSQFNFACEYLQKIVDGYTKEKNELLQYIKLVQEKSKEGSQLLERFNRMLTSIDSKTPKRIDKNDAEKLVQLHRPDYTYKWEQTVKSAQTQIIKALAFAGSMSFYTEQAIENMREQKKLLKQKYDEIDLVVKTITKDERILKKYIGVSCKLREMFLFWNNTEGKRGE